MISAYVPSAAGRRWKAAIDVGGVRIGVGIVGIMMRGGREERGEEGEVLREGKEGVANRGHVAAFRAGKRGFGSGLG